MRFYGTFFVILAMLLVNVIFLIFFLHVRFLMQHVYAGVVFLALCVGFFAVVFHEFCHLIGLLVTHNQDIVRGLSLSYRHFGIRKASEVLSKDASIVYLSSLLTVPVASLASYAISLTYWLRLVPFEPAQLFSISLAVCCLVGTYVMSQKDISDWKRSRYKYKR